jgi:hypothetical protein
MQRKGDLKLEGRRDEAEGELAGCGAGFGVFGFRASFQFQRPLRLAIMRHSADDVSLVGDLPGWFFQRNRHFNWRHVVISF